MSDSDEIISLDDFNLEDDEVVIDASMDDILGSYNDSDETITAESGTKGTDETEDFDFDTMFDGSGDDFDDEVVVDMSKYENIEDGGEPIVVAVVRESKLVYITHGTRNGLRPVIATLQKALGGSYVELPLGDENIEELKKDSSLFDAFYKKYVE